MSTSLTPEPDTPPSFIASSKRRACDRCRKLKSACPPRGSTSDPCSRCLARGLLCTTTTPSLSRGDGSSTFAGSSGFSPVTIQPKIQIPHGFGAPANPPLAAVPGPSSAAQSWPAAVDFNEHSQHISLCPPFQLSLPDDFSEQFFWPTEPSDPITLGGEASTQSQQQAAGEDDPASFMGDGDAFAALAHLTAGSSSRMESADLETDSSDHPRTRPLSRDECRTRLHSLRRRLWNASGLSLDASLGTYSGDNPDLMASAYRQAMEDRFHEALSCVSEFLAIVQSYASDEVNHEVVSEPPSDQASILVTLMDTLSAYLQIVSLFDTLFRHLNARMRNLNGQRISSQLTPQLQIQTLPGLRLAGLSVSSNQLRTEILIQAILHQFATMENILSLPVELRVSRRRATDPSCLFAYGHGSRALIDGLLTAGGPSLEDQVASLRGNIDRLKRLIDA
ncbi:hypothetical protein F4778DRAFT_260467 [Xylariomycetidae sp. FL2044]|nr:hypothetical protein F4778DRAFT_260467 [Xylariomycetidae sp. FL2044]